MRATKIQSILMIAIIISASSCSEQPLSGNWKLTQLVVMDGPNLNNRVTLDLSDPDKMKSYLYEEAIKVQDLLPDSSDITKEEIKSFIDKHVESFQNASMKLMGDNSFYMNSYGLIVPTSIPGWHFGDSLEGMWTKSGDTLIMSTGDETQSYKWKFKILKATNKELNVREVFDGFEGNGNELRFIRK